MPPVGRTPAGREDHPPARDVRARVPSARPGVPSASHQQKATLQAFQHSATPDGGGEESLASASGHVAVAGAGQPSGGGGDQGSLAWTVKQWKLPRENGSKEFQDFKNFKDFQDCEVFKDSKDTCNFQVVQELATTPRDGQGQELSSLGALEHEAGKCKPCLFTHTKVGCRNGVSCSFCHLKHNMRSRPRPCKGKRQRYRKLIDRLEQEQEANMIMAEILAQTAPQTDDGLLYGHQQPLPL